VLSSIGIDDLRQKECRHAVIRFRDNPERIIPESFPVPETVLSYPSDRQRGWESCLMASFLASGPLRHVAIRYLFKNAELPIGFTFHKACAS
jgi:hypothetical protein